MSGRPQVADPLIGYVVGGKYRLIELLGQGGMSLVYRAQHVTVGREVAIKTLSVRNLDLVRRFEKEVKVHGRLRHNNIVQVYDCIIEPNGRPFLIMEYLRGKSLEDLLAARGGVRKESLIYEIYGQLCEAMIHAHEQGVLHRDLKPGNIIVDEKDGKVNVKVVDFGLAQIQEELTSGQKAAVTAGSPLYMSPEQCMGKPLDTRSDIYSLGVVLYQLIAGKVPYDESTVIEMMAAHCDQIRKPETIAYQCRELRGAKMLDFIINAALEVEPDKRIQTMGDLKKALDLWYRAVLDNNTEDVSILFPYIYKDQFGVEEEPEELEELKPALPIEEEEEIDEFQMSQELESLVLRTQQTKAELLERRSKTPEQEHKAKTLKGWLVFVILIMVSALLYIAAHLLGVGTR